MGTNKKIELLLRDLKITIAKAQQYINESNILIERLKQINDT